MAPTPRYSSQSCHRSLSSSKQQVFSTAQTGGRAAMGGRVPGPKAWLALLLAIWCAGCATIDPYGAAEGPNLQMARTDPIIPNVEAYADEVRDRYRSGISDHAVLNSATGLGLIPLAAVAMYVGAQGGNADAVL